MDEAATLTRGAWFAPLPQTSAVALPALQQTDGYCHRRVSLMRAGKLKSMKNYTCNVTCLAEGAINL